MKFNNKQKIIVGSIIGVLIGTLFSVSYAFFTFSKTGATNSTLVTGNIWMKYGETNGLTLENAMPSNTYDSTHKFEFTIEGANTTTDKDVWYEIIAKRGNVPDGKTEENRLQDKYIKFTLTKQIGNGTVETVVDGESWEGLTSGKKIYVDKIDKNTSSTTTHKYVLYMWISDKVGIGTNTTYTISQWNNLFASIKVDVNGDFTEKFADRPYYTVNAMINIYNTGNAIEQQKANIKEVYFNRMKEDAMQSAYNNATIKADLTYNNEGKVLAWLEENEDDNTKYNLIVASDGETYFPTSAMGMFNRFSNMTKIEFNNVNTNRVTIMAGMFQDCSNLTTINLSSFNTTNVTIISGMFNNTGLTEINLSNFNLENMTAFGLFGNCLNLRVIDLSGTHRFSAQNAMNDMFKNLSSLEKIYVPSDFDASNHWDTIYMFEGCTSLVGGNGTRYIDKANVAETGDNSYKNKTYAVIDNTEHEGYLTDIADKPTT